jgi:hypothetical protein
MWMEISNINAKKIYIAICYSTPINSTFYKKNNLDKNCPYNLEEDIHSLRNNGDILLLGDFNAKTTTNQAVILSNDSNPNPLWLDKGLVLDSKYKRNSKDFVENLFRTYNSQDLIICNDLMKWLKSNRMICIQGFGNNVVDHVIFDILVYNQIINFDLLNDHELDSNHRP